MKWLNKLKVRLAPDIPPEVSEETKNIYNDAHAALCEARERQREVSKVTSVIVDLRERNHFGESFERAMARREKTA